MKRLSPMAPPTPTAMPARAGIEAPLRSDVGWIVPAAVSESPALQLELGAVLRRSSVAPSYQ